MSLVGWWALHETESNKATDLSGNGNQGTLGDGSTSSTYPTQGVAGKAGLTSYSFDGSSQYINLGNFFNEDGVHTISAWVKQESSAYEGIFETRSLTSPYQGFELSSLDNNKLRLYVMDDNNTVESIHSDNAYLNEWVHVVGVINQAKGYIKLYTNGTLDGVKNRPSGSMTYSGDTRIGSNSDSSGEFWTGNIADVRLYDHELSPQKIQTLYNQGSQDYTDQSLHDGSDSGAVSRWTFDDTVNDSWGSNDGGSSTSSGYASNSIRGKSMQFNGTDEYIEISDSADLHFGSGNFSISCWVKFDDFDSPYRIVMKRNTSDFAGYELITDSSGEPSFICNDGSENSKANGKTLNTNCWYQITGVRKGEKFKLYINGSVRDSTTNSSVGNLDTSVPLNIGAWETGTRSRNYMDGKIDDVRIYNRALKPYEVFQLYQWGTKGRDMRKQIVNARGKQ